MVWWKLALALYLAAVNVLAFVLMAVDKRKAQSHRRRIPEKTLFLSAILGGGAGALAGMYACHHKTRHRSFVVGMPLLLLLWAALAVWLFSRAG